MKATQTKHFCKLAELSPGSHISKLHQSLSQDSFMQLWYLCLCPPQNRRKGGEAEKLEATEHQV